MMASRQSVRKATSAANFSPIASMSGSQDWRRVGRSGAGEPEEGDMPSAVVHGPGHSPVAGPEAAQVGVASKAHRSIGRRYKAGPHGGCIVLLFSCLYEPPSTRRVLAHHVPSLPLASREPGL